MNVYNLMERIKGMLSGYGVKSIKIGAESSLNPDDYPMIRIVPNANIPDEFDAWAQDVHFSVLIGARLDTHSLEEGYRFVYKLEAAIYQKLHNYQFSDGGLVRFIKSERDGGFEHFLVVESSYKIDSFRL